MSTVVYRTTCAEWSPHQFREGVPGIDAYEQVHETVNEEKHTLIVVLGRRTPLPWGDVESLFDWVWDLYVVVWSPAQNLLFINSSANAGEYAPLAKAVAGEDATSNQRSRCLSGLRGREPLAIPEYWPFGAARPQCPLYGSDGRGCGARAYGSPAGARE